MFSGLVAALGRVERVESAPAGARLHVAAPFTDLVLGESIAVSGACLTVVGVGPAGFVADLSRETLERTTLGELRPGDAVNLERAMALGE
ncbi:MAG TPA: riboflavin synthase, partial [Polyangiaceae bacterium]|nr:riboflavin synthase [Polyangiaceae bacterium]